MARQQVGMIDAGLLARVDAAAAAEGLTRRAFMERALERWLDLSEPAPGRVTAVRQVVTKRDGGAW